MSVQQVVTQLIRTARQLRDIAGELEQLELKSTLVDCIGTLQELRDEIPGATDTNFEMAAAETVAAEAKPAEAKPAEANPAEQPEPASQLRDSGGMVVIEPSSDGETYGFSVGEELEPEPEEKPAKPAPVQVGPSIDELKAKDPSELTETDRTRLAEARMRELEPQHQAILKRMNDLLTEEQRVTKKKVTRAGRAAGKAAKQIQKEVIAALKLTDQQKMDMAECRKQLQEIRVEMSKQVDGLLSEDQQREIQKSIQNEQSRST